MYSITENIYYSQLSSVAILLQPEPVSHRIIQGNYYFLSLCAIIFRSPPASHASTSRSVKLAVILRPLYYGCATRSRQKRGVGWSNFTLHSISKTSLNLPNNRETKLVINDSTSLVSLPLSISVSLLFLSVTSYMQRHTTRVTWSVFVKQEVFCNSIVRMRNITLSFHPSTSRDFSWRANLARWPWWQGPTCELLNEARGRRQLILPPSLLFHHFQQTSCDLLRGSNSHVRSQERWRHLQLLARDLGEVILANIKQPLVCRLCEINYKTKCEISGPHGDEYEV
jgi:hypothetical protein